MAKSESESMVAKPAANGKAIESALRVIKLAIGIVLIGGGAAFAAGKMAVEGHSHPDLHAEIHRAHWQAMEANANVQAMMRMFGEEPIKLDPDAGHGD